MRNVMTIEVEDKEYQFEFDRKTITKAEKNGLDLEQLGKYPLTMTLKLWHWALIKNHPSITEFDSSNIYDKARDKGYDIEKINSTLGEMYASFFKATPQGTSELIQPTFNQS